MKVEKQASQELVSSHSYATCISWGINTCSYRWGVLHTELVTGRVCPGWQVWICNSWKLMAKSPRLQKCSGAGWKQSQIPQTKKKRMEKIRPIQKPTRSRANCLTKSKTPRSPSLWQTFKTNSFRGALHRRLPKMQARRETSAEPPNDWVLLFYPH